ncbi:NAD-dependent epimerase/dehydratase family protein [Opitutia bacterium ISCC 51]|nr:NAD-dependent epimerase/dehydratase family protein [Opitutae bacterium ISCC 51]QXD26606.1 NAD-dependent epimerase/dehydratase family protein [Opitutae bacterium ISCC 52]
MEENEFKGKHLLVCGMGYLGKRVARQALDRGMRVTALTRSAEKAEALRKEGYEMIVADLVQQAWYQDVTEPVDYILNCVSAGGGGVDGYVRAYIEGMHSLLHYCTGDFNGRLIYTSSTGVYPFSDGEIVTEDTPFDPQSETSEILKTSEGFLQRSGPDHWAILRLAGIYGPDRHYLLNQIRSGEIELSGEGGNYLNLIHVDDICSAIWSVWEADESALNTIYNVSDDQPALKEEVVSWLAEKTGNPMPQFNPKKSIRQRHLPNGKLPNRIISNKKLKAATGWQPEYPTYREGFAGLIG